MDATLVHFGSAVKALGDGKIGGYLVTFSDAQSPDLTGDYFTKDTDYDIADGDSRSVYYAHGLDEQLGVKKIGRFTAKTDAIGIWVEAQLNLRDEYDKAIADLAAKGKLGWSSGAPAHLVARKSVETKDGTTVREILTWPIAEGSLTPTPAEPRNDAFALKSLAELLATEDGIKATWPSAYVNDLPDSAFGYIESGGTKDDEGKTTPRSLRHFPYKAKDGKPDPPHVRNALARIPQSNLPDSAKNSAFRKVRAAAKELGIEVGDGKQADVTELREMLTRSMTFSDHADVAHEALAGFVTRAERAIGMDIKAGRVISAANRAKMQDNHAGMQEAHALLASLIEKLGTLLSETDPEVQKAADAAFVRFLAHEAHALGVAV